MISQLLVGLLILGAGFMLGHLVMGKRHYLAGYADGIIAMTKINNWMTKKGIMVIDEDKFNELITGNKGKIDGLDLTVHRD